MIIATAGHVDHGKTALVRALTGQETDRTEEERRRGLSIELGYAWMNLPGGGTIDLVDVPGHARFMRTLVAGVGCVDGVMLVVAADDGVMPQTLEHLQLIRLLRLPLALIVVTKCARVSAERAQAVADQAVTQAGQLGLPPSPVHRVDSLGGQGMDRLREELIRLGASVSSTPERATRMLVDRHFSVEGIGQIVTGTLAQGSLSVGERLVLSATSESVRIRGIQIHGQSVDRVSSGSRCALNLTGSLPERIERGTQLLDPAVYRPTTRVDLVLDSQLGALPRELQLHLNGAVVNARLVPLRLALDDPEGVVMQAVLAEPICCRLGDRLVLRDPAGQRLLGGGKVIDPFPPQKGRHQPQRKLILTALLAPEPHQQLSRLLDTLPGMLDLLWYRQATHVPAQELESALQEIEPCSPLLRQGDQLCLLSRAQALGEQLRDVVAAWHAEQASRPGIPLAQLAWQLEMPLQDPLLRLVLRSCLDGAKVVQRGAAIALPGFVMQPDPQSLAWMTDVSQHFADAAPRPPVLGEMMQRLGLEREDLIKRLEHLSAQGQLLRIGRNRYLTIESFEQLCAVAAELSQVRQGAGFSTAEFRDRSGVGRNHSVAILECFDRLGVTRRLSDDRRVVL